MTTWEELEKKNTPLIKMLLIGVLLLLLLLCYTFWQHHQLQQYHQIVSGSYITQEQCDAQYEGCVPMMIGEGADAIPINNSSIVSVTFDS